jgi:hypothetical protein
VHRGPTDNRQVLGSMNDSRNMLGFYLEEGRTETTILTDEQKTPCESTVRGRQASYA